MKQIVKRYDLACLGGGPASLLAARRAAQYGKSVCVIERGKLGGVCLNKGCIPKKLLYCAAQVYKDAIMAAEYGVWTRKEGKKENKMYLNPELLQKRVKNFVSMASRAVESVCLKGGVDTLTGVGKFVEPTTIQVTEADLEIVVKADKVLIATGSSPYLPNIKGIEKTINSDTLYDMEKLPKSLLVIGADYIGMESAALMNMFEVKTSVCMREKTMLSKFDKELAELGMEHLKARGIVFHPNTNVDRIETTDKGELRAKTRDGKNIDAEAIMVAVGRRSNTRGLGLEKVGIKLGPKGEIVVDEYDATTVPNVYALGDVSGRSSLATVAKVASKLLVDRLFGPGTEKPAEFRMDYTEVPSAVFSNPPLARCGLTEEEAAEKYGEKNVKVYKQQGYQLMHALVENKEPMMVKIVMAEKGGKETVVGVHAIGRNVEEIISGFALAMKKGLTREDLEKAIPVHPTLSEEFLNLFQWLNY